MDAAAFGPLLPLTDPLFSWLTLGTGLFWTFAYVAIIRRGWADRTYGMPIPALCANVCWEFIFSFIDPGRPPQLYINYLWLALDLVIVAQTLRVGPTVVANRFDRRHFYPAFAVGIVVSLLLLHAANIELGDMGVVYTAFAQNLLMSVLFMRMLVNRNDASGQSIYIAVFKLLGTLCAATVFFLNYPGSQLLNVLYVEIFAFDLLYCIALHRMFRSQNLNPWRVL